MALSVAFMEVSVSVKIILSCLDNGIRPCELYSMQMVLEMLTQLELSAGGRL